MRHLTRFLAATTIGIFAALPGAAQQGADDPYPLAHEASVCDARASALNLVEPWGRHSKGHGSGGRIALLDLGGAPETRYHVLIIAQPNADRQTRLCHILSITEPGIALTDRFAIRALRRQGEAGLEATISGALHIDGHERLADAVLRIGVAYPSGDTRFEVLSAGPPWPHGSKE